MEDKILNFIQQNSPDGGFLQSEHWRKFQESVGRKTYAVSAKNENGESIAHANIVTHTLPIVGNYFYVPRGPVLEKSKIQKPNDKQNPKSKIQNFLDELIDLAKKKNAGWIRVEPKSDSEMSLLRNNISEDIKIKKSSVDMQPREILVIDISKSEEMILEGMKQKTRYNIRLAQKKNIKISVGRDLENIDAFCQLVEITAKRDKIMPHPEKYYRKMFDTIPPEILKLYVARYEEKIIVANLVLFFGNTATYMHGASDNENRNVMAPHALQWRQICDAKKAGCERYDLGGVKIESRGEKSWDGITKFKTGFAPDVQPIHFHGSYDIILRPSRYGLYRFLQRIKRTI